MNEQPIMLPTCSLCPLYTRDDACGGIEVRTHRSIRRVLPLATAPSSSRMWQLRWPGTACRLVSRRNHLGPRSGASSRHYFLPEAIPTASTAHDKLFSFCAANSVFLFYVVFAVILTLRHLNKFFDERMNEWMNGCDAQLASRRIVQRNVRGGSVREFVSGNFPVNNFRGEDVRGWLLEGGMSEKISSGWKFWEKGDFSRGCMGKFGGNCPGWVSGSQCRITSLSTYSGCDLVHQGKPQTERQVVSVSLLCTMSSDSWTKTIL